MRGSAAFRAAVAPGGALAGPWVRNELWRRARAVPSLDLRFAENKSLVDATTGQNLVTLTRASSATYVDSTGTIRSAVTNLLTNSESLTTGFSQQNTTVTSDATAAPDGAITADLSVPNATSASHSSFRTNITLAASANYALSIFVKPFGYTHLQLLFTSGFGNTNAWANFVLSGNGSLGFAGTSGTASIQALSNGWYRCSLVATSGASATTGGPAIAVLDSNRNARDANYAGNGTDGIYIWGAQLEQSSTVGDYIPTTSTINSAPRFDHNPTTGESLGLLVEEQRTNGIRNNTMVGAVAGTPGTLPTNWSVATSGGLTTNVIGAGVSAGISYVDLQITGTPTGAAYVLQFEGFSTVTAAATQTWTLSSWLARAAGSETNISGIQLRMRTYTSGISFIAQSDSTNLTIASGMARLSHNYASLPATTAYIEPALRLVLTIGSAIDITLRIGMPQLEQGAFATSVIPTSGTAATRSADVASITGTNFNSLGNVSSGTLYGELVARLGVGQEVFSLNASTANGTGVRLRKNIFNQYGLVVRDGAIRDLNLAPSSAFVENQYLKVAGAFSANDTALSGGGQNPVTGSVFTVPNLNEAYIGPSTAIGAACNGIIRRLCYWPTRLPNTTLQALTQ